MRSVISPQKICLKNGLNCYIIRTDTWQPSTDHQATTCEVMGESGGGGAGGDFDVDVASDAAAATNSWLPGGDS